MAESFSRRPRPPKVAVIGTMMEYYAPIIGPDFRHIMAAHVAATVSKLSPSIDLQMLGLWADDADTDGLSRALAASGADVLLLVPAMCTPPAAVAEIARASGLPVVIAGPHELTSVGADYDMQALCRHSVNVGASMMGAMLRRFNGPVPVLVSGYLDETVFHDRLKSALRAAALSTRMRGLRVGRLGAPMAGYDHVGLTEEEGRLSGLTVVDVPLADWSSRVALVTDNEIRGFVAECLPSLIPAQAHVETGEQLDRAARLALALDRLADDLSLDCGSLSCRGPFGVGLAQAAIGCLATSLLTGTGRPFSATGDLVTAVAMLIGKTLGGATLYCELDAVDRDSGSFLVANTGEADFDWNSANGAAAIRASGSLSGREVPGVVLSHELAAGPATMLGLTLDRSRSERLSLIALQGETLARPPTALKVTQGWFRSAGPDPITDFESWANAGATHHGALSKGHLAEAAGWLARLCDWPITAIPAGGTNVL